MRIYKPSGAATSSDEVLMTNDGGRIRRLVGSKTRLLQLDGSISKDCYQVTDDRSDRHGLIGLVDKKGTLIRVHYRRLMPYDDTKACVVQSGVDKFAICPSCCGLHPALSQIECCGSIYDVSDAVTMIPDCVTDIIDKGAMMDEHGVSASQANSVNETELKQLENCELWVRRNLPFDHERVTVCAYALLYVGAEPRKLCFNTYDGCLGKRGETLPVNEFLANQPLTGKQTCKWYPVKDLKQARSKLAKSSYEQVT